jgi:tRNA A37 threonylcarbamoyladenosine dehydratase
MLAGGKPSLICTQERYAMIHRFSRTELLVGKAGLAALGDAKAAVFGIGGVGSYAAEALARSGIGSLTLVDHDRVDITNLNRQIHALESTVGMYKADVMERRILDINPHCRVELIREFFEPDQEERFLAKGYDYVIDAIDSVPSKVGLISGCLQRGIPIVSAMGAANKLDPTGFQVVDISETYNDPLARVVRRRLRDMGISKGVKVVFSPELPAVRHGQGCNATKERQPPGTVAFVPAVAGLILAGVVVRELLEAYQAGQDTGD